MKSHAETLRRWIAGSPVRLSWIGRNLREEPAKHAGAPDGQEVWRTMKGEAFPDAHAAYAAQGAHEGLDPDDLQRGLGIYRSLLKWYLDDDDRRMWISMMSAAQPRVMMCTMRSVGALDQERVVVQVDAVNGAGAPGRMQVARRIVDRLGITAAKEIEVMYEEELKRVYVNEIELLVDSSLYWRIDLAREEHDRCNSGYAARKRLEEQSRADYDTLVLERMADAGLEIGYRASSARREAKPGSVERWARIEWCRVLARHLAGGQ